ncbi:MAG: ThuA domain-containing protein [Planctomycetota bacterium]|nr:ThuA domain-containing protein [Planctomycetota bacterium]
MIQVLVFSHTAGFRHDSIDAGIKAIQELGQSHDFHVVATEDPTRFSSLGLKGIDVIVFLSTTGDVLNDDQQKAFEQYMDDGGGYVGIHAASDTEYDWPFYGSLVGAYFHSHPAIQEAIVMVVDPQHPATSFLPLEWRRTDEWYNFREAPLDSVQILLTLDTSSYEGSTMASEHPIAWCHEIHGGHAFYTGLGHPRESFEEPLFLRHLLEGIRWAGRSAKPTGDS